MRKLVGVELQCSRHFADKDGCWDLQKIADHYNRMWFSDAILLDEIKWVRDTEAEKYFCGGYYVGDEFHGKIHAVHFPRMHRCCQIPATAIVGHEMLHQLIIDHTPEFHAIDAIWHPKHWGQEVSASTVRLLARLVLNNIVKKIDKGLLPHSHLEKFKQSDILKRSLQ